MDLDRLHGREGKGGARLRVVLIHGIRPRPTAWAGLTAKIALDPDLEGVEIYSFQYASPTFRYLVRPQKIIPSQDAIAQKLRTYIGTLGQDVPLALVAHSQGGLISQRYLGELLSDRAVGELRLIRMIVLLACPNSGSDLMLALRKGTAFILSPQERNLRPLDAEIARMHSLVVNKLAHKSLDDAIPTIPIYAYAGEEDGVVKPNSAWGAFPNKGMLSGDHSSILDFDNNNTINYTVVRRHLIEACDEGSTNSGGSRLPVLEPRQGLNPQVKLHGRVHELEELGRFLRQEDPGGHSILLLTGPGGIGKSELVAHALAASRGARAGGDLYVDLRGLPPESCGERITSTFLDGLGVPAEDRPVALEGRRSLLMDMLERRGPALVFDNVEAGHPISKYLPALGSCRAVLITADAYLPSSAGQRIALGPLEPQASEQMLAESLAAAGIQTNHGQNDLSRLAHELGHWPLALVLAGANFGRPSFDGIDQLIRELRTRSRGFSAVEPRSSGRGMHAAIEYTLDCTTFKARTLASAIAHLPASESTSHLASAFVGDDVGREWKELVDARILHSTGRARVYRLLDPIRTYIMGQGGEEAAALPERTRNLSGALLTARAALEPDRPFYGRPVVAGPAPMNPLDELDVEVALKSVPGLIIESLDNGEIETALLLANALPTYEIIRGTCSEFWGPLRRLAAYPIEGPQRVGLGYVRQALANLGRTMAHGDGGDEIEAAINIFTDVNDREGMGYALNDRGLIQMYRRDFDKSEKTLQESESLLRESGHPIMALQSWRNRALSYLESENASRAACELKACREAMEAAGDVRWAAYTRADEGKARMSLGEHSRALTLLKGAIDDMRSMGDQRWASVTRLRYADSLRIVGQVEDALGEFEQAIAYFADTGDPLWHARARLGLGLASASSRRVDRRQLSVACCEKACEAFYALGSRWDLVRGKVTLARVHTVLGDSTRAEAALATARELAEMSSRDGVVIPVSEFMEDLGPDVR